MNSRITLIYALAVLIFVPMILFLAALAYGQAQERRVVYRYLEEALGDTAPTKFGIEWQAGHRDLARPFGAEDETRIGRALNAAWRAFGAVQDSGNVNILPDYFSGIALRRGERAAETARAEGTRMVVLDQTARPEFYHLDGSVFQAVVDMTVVRFVVEDGRLSYLSLSTDTTRTTLMNESSGWRVFAHERLGATPVPFSPAPWVPMRLAGINYYPAETPWRDFWPMFDADIIAQDFARIRDLRANSIRIFLPRDAFFDATGQGENIKNLRVLLDFAQAKGLRVIPTLFDLKGDFGVSAWGDDVRYLQNVVPVLADHPAVIMIDLKNEPDLDYAAHGAPRIQAWLTVMAHMTRQMAPNMLLTIGWSKVDHARDLEGLMDVITYHDYAPVAQATQSLTELQNQVAPKPVMITEFGTSSWSAVMDWPETPQTQADAIKARMAALNAADGLFIWTLHDFPSPDSRAVGSSPWVKGLQSSFGVIAPDGQEKPAAEVLRRGFQDFLKGQE